MRLPNILEKIKDLEDLPKDVFILLVIFLVATGAYLLGEHSALEEKRSGELRIVEQPRTSAFPVATNSDVVRSQKPEGSNAVLPADTKGMYVGSRSGTTYHLPWCSGAKRIREENKIWFSSKEEAAAGGYRPATNCKGI